MPVQLTRNEKLCLGCCSFDSLITLLSRQGQAALASKHSAVGGSLAVVLCGSVQSCQGGAPVVLYMYFHSFKQRQDCSWGQELCKCCPAVRCIAVCNASMAQDGQWVAVVAYLFKLCVVHLTIRM
jgi:hypothetical protein